MRFGAQLNVGDSDPLKAIEDPLRTFSADELVVVHSPTETPPGSRREAGRRPSLASPFRSRTSSSRNSGFDVGDGTMAGITGLATVYISICAGSGCSKPSTSTSTTEPGQHWLGKAGRRLVLPLRGRGLFALQLVVGHECDLCYNVAPVQDLACGREQISLLARCCASLVAPALFERSHHGFRRQHLPHGDWRDPRVRR